MARRKLSRAKGREHRAGRSARKRLRIFAREIHSTLLNGTRAFQQILPLNLPWQLVSAFHRDSTGSRVGTASISLGITIDDTPESLTSIAKGWSTVTATFMDLPSSSPFLPRRFPSVIGTNIELVLCSRVPVEPWVSPKNADFVPSITPLSRGNHPREDSELAG